MPMSRDDLLAFMRKHRYGVVSSVGPQGRPQAALVGFVANDACELFFDSFASTRKVGNLRADPRVAVVIGGMMPGDERTVQYEGVVDEPSGEVLEQFQKQYFADLHDGKRRSKLPGILYFRVRPRWIRYTDYNVSPPRVEEFSAESLG